MPATRVKRITLPRYEVEYEDARGAVEDARRLRDSNILVLEHAMAGEIGSEVVLDLGVSALTLHISFLFRIVQRHAQTTILDWWARRATDPDLLAVYVESLQEQVNMGSGPTSSGRDAPVASVDLRRMLEACRRALSHNPFTAINVHWSAGPREVAEALARTRLELESYRAQKSVPERVSGLVAKALEELPRTGAQISTLEGRVRARTLFVPADQIRQARDLAISRAELARLRGDLTEITRTSAELAELQTRTAK